MSFQSRTRYWTSEKCDSQSFDDDVSPVVGRYLALCKSVVGIWAGLFKDSSKNDEY